jgi:hypothetical protein
MASSIQPKLPARSDLRSALVIWRGHRNRGAGRFAVVASALGD